MLNTDAVRAALERKWPAACYDDGMSTKSVVLLEMQLFRLQRHTNRNIFAPLV